MSIEIRPAKASDMEFCAALYKEIYNTVYQGIVDSRLITSITQEDTVQRMRGDWLQPGGEFWIAEDVSEAGERTFLGFTSGLPSPEEINLFPIKAKLLSWDDLNIFEEE